MTGITPLEAWIRKKAAINDDLTGPSFHAALESYQLQKVNDVIDYAHRCTPFYHSHLACFPAPLSGISEMAGLPFTTPSDIAKDPYGFLAVRQDDVARIVTLRTSGSTGEAKRLFFTEDDLELTVDFFHHGMSTLVKPGQRVAILLPGEMPDSVGDLLARGLARMDVRALVHGPVKDPVHTAEAIASFEADCLVGIPTQVLWVACSRQGSAIGKGRIKSVLLSTDYVPRAIADRLEDIWGCRVFNHYGMTEMGLGGGVECEAINGYHLREADLYFEIVNHETGEPCPAGTAGEVVFTTLTRQGMPLIRYRTGDISRMILEPCLCGSALRRMEPVRGRWDGAFSLGPGFRLAMSDMDEALFRLPGLLDYRATVSKERNKRHRLQIDVYGIEGEGPTEGEVLNELKKIDSIACAIDMAFIEKPVVCFTSEGRWSTNGTAKRKIVRNNPLRSLKVA